MKRTFIGTRIIRKVRIENDCWIWEGTTADGYGTVWDSEKQKKVYVHKAIYELVIGPVTYPLQLDHLCRNRACCNPFHLEPVTQKENLFRGGGNFITMRTGICKRGHHLTPDNIASNGDGRRRCKKCANERLYQKELRQHE